MSKGLLRLLGARNVIHFNRIQDALPYRASAVWNGINSQNIPLNSVGFPRYINGATIGATGVVKREDGLMRRIMDKFSWFKISKSRLKLAAFMMYENITLGVNYKEWFEYCNLPDTFASWFMITELHIWMLMVRCEEEDLEGGSGNGRYLRNTLVEALWLDVIRRVEQLGGPNSRKGKEQVTSLSEQFRAAILGYDEGLTASVMQEPYRGHGADIKLAGAVWRRLFERNLDDAEKLETVVRFIRKQIFLLEKIHSSKLIDHQKRNIKWLSIKDNST